VGGLACIVTFTLIRPQTLTETTTTMSQIKREKNRMKKNSLGQGLSRPVTTATHRVWAISWAQLQQKFKVSAEITLTSLCDRQRKVVGKSKEITSLRRVSW